MPLSRALAKARHEPEPTSLETRRAAVLRSLTTWAHVALTADRHVPAAHHRRILEALERVERGETRRLMLLLPPGSAKSTYASRLFPPWWLARNRRSSVITACHTAGLAEHFGRAVRGLIDEFGDLLDLQVRDDARAAGRFITEQGGDYFAVGVHGAVTGRRADLALIDDPVRSFAEAESFEARERLWNWFRAELVTRLKPRGRMVLVMTRWHTDDLAGRLIGQGGWQVLRFPALAEPDDPLDRAPGAALWPEWESREAILAKRDQLGERSFAAQFQQAPQPDTGLFFDLGNVPVVDSCFAGVAVRGWDLAASAATSGDPDWTVGVRLLREEMGGRYVVEDVIRMRGGPAEVAARVRAAAQADGREVAIGLPKDPGQAGISQVYFLTSQLSGFRVISSPEKDSKARRASFVASQMAAGNIALRRAAWNRVFLEELASFPNGNKDDQVDALSRAFGMLADKGTRAHFTSLSHYGR